MNSRVLCSLSAVLSIYAAAVAGQDYHDPSSVRYLLWTRTNPGDTDYYLLHVNLSNLASSPFNDQLRTLFLIHGWLDTGLDPWIKAAKTNYLTVSNCNVISVDWQQIASNPNYGGVAQDMYIVVNMTSRLIDKLVGMTALTTGMIHITGHSLGGQMAGMIGKYVTVGKLDRVTGLDPAGPLFYTKTSNERIDKSDADFVDIIHSNGGSILEACLGLFLPVGHVNFYPNGGKRQPGCSFADIYSTCSHDRAHEFWVESILAGHNDQFPNELLAWPCSDYETYQQKGCPTCGQGCLTMGFYVDRKFTGSYYLTTNSNSPYAEGFIQ